MAVKTKITLPVETEDPMVSLDAAMHLLRENVTEWIWLQQHLQDNGGYIKFNRRLYKRFQIDDLPYGQFFGHPLAPVLAALTPYYSIDKFRELCKELDNKSFDERSDWMMSNNELASEIDEFTHFALALPGSLSFSELRQIIAVKQQIERMPQHKREPLIRQAKTFQCGVIACFYEYAAVGVMGRRMTTLVHAASNGCHDSFAAATGMIPRLTSDVPALRRIHSMMQINPELTGLKDKVADAQKSPPFAGKIKNKALWISLSVLDGLNLLGKETRRKDIFAGLERIGIFPSEEERHSVQSLNRAVGRYRERQQNFTLR